MKLSILYTSFIASDSTFSPAIGKIERTTALSASFTDEVGVTEPVCCSTIAVAPSDGHGFFSQNVCHRFIQIGFYDPLGLLTDATSERFERLRAVELKHGRISMLAVVGYLTTAAGIRFPGAEDIPDGLKSFPALHLSADGYSVLMQMVAFFAVAEMVNRDAMGEAEFVGDFRNGALDFGWNELDEETKLRKRNIELNQGRAAMMGITALVTHEAIGVSILPNGYLPGH